MPPQTANARRIKRLLADNASKTNVARSQLRAAVAELPRLELERDALLDELHAESERRR